MRNLPLKTFLSIVIVDDLGMVFALLMLGILPKLSKILSANLARPGSLFGMDTNVIVHVTFLIKDFITAVNDANKFFFDSFRSLDKYYFVSLVNFFSGERAKVFFGLSFNITFAEG